MTDTGDLVLPAPSLSRQWSLDRAFRLRRSTRLFLPDPLSPAALSTLLWVAFGINRPSSGGRTAPSAHDWREMDVYAVMASGAYCYEPHDHRLRRVSAQDLRSDTGTQDFVSIAPLDLVYVADYARMTDVQSEERDFLAGADAGCIAQNVYLCCAAMGLATVVRGLIDRRRLAQALGLQPTQRIALAHSVGHPGRHT